MWARYFLCLSAVLCLAHARPQGLQLRVNTPVTSPVTNIHFNSVQKQSFQELIVSYGSCAAAKRQPSDHVVYTGRLDGSDRLIWTLPDSPVGSGCISAWDVSGGLLGRSEPINVNLKRHYQQREYRLRKKRQEAPSIKMTEAYGIDPLGPWFDGVLALQKTNISVINSQSTKDKEIAIVGAGMAGLMTWMALNEAGLTNVTILEASNRLGGRVRTWYIGDAEDRQYQDESKMGPMRLPELIQYAGSNETLPIKDHQIVFDLVNELNSRNAQQDGSQVSLIPWIQSSENGLMDQGGIRLPNGELPTVGDLAANASLIAQSPSGGQLDQMNAAISQLYSNETFMSLLSDNLYRAHREWVNNGLEGLGGDDWSEFAYVHNYLQFALNDTVISQARSFGFWSWDLLYESRNFGATTWKTIDGGMDRLAAAFGPLVDNGVKFGAKVSGISYNETRKRVALQVKSSNDFRVPSQKQEFDYAIVTAPLSVVRTWRLPTFTTALSAAVQSYPYEPICKVGLQFQSRFWEHLDRPIFGSCSSVTDTPGIGSICYPSYDLNGTGPGVLLASYTVGNQATQTLSTPDDEHVAYVLDAMARLHGEVVYDQYTGQHKKHCWLSDQHAQGAYAQAGTGMRSTFLPAFFEVQQGIIFAGDATTITSAWISSSLESGVRAAVQLLLELGLVDEAQDVARKWMARWIVV